MKHVNREEKKLKDKGRRVTQKWKIMRCKKVKKQQSPFYKIKWKELTEELGRIENMKAAGKRGLNGEQI